jgi:hypothetical protein
MTVFAHIQYYGMSEISLEEIIRQLIPRQQNTPPMKTPLKFDTSSFCNQTFVYSFLFMQV